MASEAANGHIETWIAFVLMKREPHSWFTKPGVVGVLKCLNLKHTEELGSWTHVVQHTYPQVYPWPSPILIVLTASQHWRS